MICIADKVKIRKTKHVGKVVGVEYDNKEHYLIVEFKKGEEMKLPMDMMEECSEGD